MDINNIYVLQLIASLTVLFVGFYVYRNERILIKVEDKLRTTCKEKDTLPNEIHKELNEAGSSFIRWGRTDCDGTHSQLIYSGYAAGQHYKDKGGPSNMLCLPDNPELSNVKVVKEYSSLNGTEYEADTLRIGSIDKDVPCAVCESRQTHMSIMIPGRMSCYDGWKLEYNGLIASDYIGYSSSSYVCVDSHPKFIIGGQNDENGRLLYFTSTKCGALPCPPYKNDVAVNCVVCSK